MNWAQFKKNVGMWVQLEPIACRLDETGQELPQVSHDWIVQSFSPEDEVTLRNIATGHVAQLGKDHFYDFRSNPSKSQGGVKHGFLVLKMQVFMQGSNLWYRPNAKPGERVSPHHTPQSQPSEVILHLLNELAKSNGWAGRPAEFNRYAARLLYGTEFGDLLTDPADYFSALLINDYVLITSLTDHGNRPDGAPDTTVAIELTSRGNEALAR